MKTTTSLDTQVSALGLVEMSAEEQTNIIGGKSPFYDAGVWVGEKIAAAWDYIF